MSKRHRSRRGRDRKGATNVRTTGTEGATGAEGASKAAGAAGSPTRTAQATAPTRRPARWWERFPERREFELEALRRAGLEPNIVDDGERLVVRVQITFEGKRHPAIVQFPDLYPYMRCEVLAPTLHLRKHQNPFGGNLCLLDRSTAEWDVGDTAARLILDQLPKVEKAVGDPSPRPDLEVPQAEPVSTYYEGVAEEGSLVLIPPEATRLPRGLRGGVLQVAVTQFGPRLRGAVTAINDIRGTLPKSVLPGGESRAVRWARLSEPPGPPETLLTHLLEQGVLKVPQLRDATEELFAFAFPEEVAYGEATEMAWLFVRWKRAGNIAGASLVRTERFDPAQQALRIPALAGLAAKRIALFGIGGIGAPLGHQLLQMRTGQLRIVDHDLLRVGNAVRWPLGLQAAGLRKTDAFAEFARSQYPETEVVSRRWRIGSSALDAYAPDETKLLEEALSGADLVIDATAELGIQYLLTEAARDMDIPAITVEGRAGGYGGMVVRYRPQGPGCYLCFRLHRDAGRFRVPDDPNGRRVQPRGCADPTFTGAVFDLVPISSLGARLAAQTLVPSEALPDAPYDIALLYSREHRDSREHRGMDVPRWEYHTLEPNQACPRCGSAVS